MSNAAEDKSSVESVRRFRYYTPPSSRIHAYSDCLAFSIAKGWSVIDDPLYEFAPKRPCKTCLKRLRLNHRRRLP